MDVVAGNNVGVITPRVSISIGADSFAAGAFNEEVQGLAVLGFSMRWTSWPLNNYHKEGLRPTFRISHADSVRARKRPRRV